MIGHETAQEGNFQLFAGDIKRESISSIMHQMTIHSFLIIFLIPFSLVEAQKSTRHFQRLIIDEKYFSKCLTDGAHRVWNEFEMIKMIGRVVYLL